MPSNEPKAPSTTNESEGVEQLQKRLEEWSLISPIGYDELKKTIDKWLVVEDQGIVKLLCAIILSHLFKGDPIWLYLIAPPSSGKTEFLRALNSVLTVYTISNLTPNAFLSGSLKKNTSLLLNLGSPIFIFKDWTNILSQDRDTRNEIMGQLREVYDGYLDKTTGNGTLKWRGKVTIIAGVTNEIDMSSNKSAGLGERFINYRFTLPNTEKASQKAIENFNQSKQMRKEMSEAFAAFMRNWVSINIKNKKYKMELKEKVEYKDLAAEYQKEIFEIANFTAKARASVIREFGGKKEILFVHPPEMPMRMIKQFITIMKAFYILNGNKYDKEDLKIIHKIAFDSIHMNLKEVLLSLAKRDYQTTKEIALDTRRPTEMTRYILEDLNVKGMCERVEEGGEGDDFDPMAPKKRGDRWTLNKEFTDILCKYNNIERDQVVDTATAVKEEFEGVEVDRDSVPFDML